MEVSVPDHRPAPSLLLADDQSAMLEVISELLRDRFDIVSKVKNGADMVRECLRLAPAVALADISMPGLNGIDATAELKRDGCNTRVVILSSHGAAAFVRAALAAGAIGYVLKERMFSDLPRAIEAALQGKTFISPALGHLALDAAA